MGLVDFHARAAADVLPARGTPEVLALGYLPRGSPLYGPIRDAGGTIEVLANIRGSYSHGEEKWIIGIFLDIA